MVDFKTIEVPIQGMDCAECTRHVRQAIAALPGVVGVEVYLAGEKAVVRLVRVDAGAGCGGAIAARFDYLGELGAVDPAEVKSLIF